MALKRTTVFAEEADLAVLKKAAARRGVAEAELIRDAIHLAAMANRVWSEPFFRRAYARVEPAEESSSSDPILDQVWDDKAADYEQTKSSRR